MLEATEHRLRPILLTAAAAILGMIPIMHDVFWGPMAYAIAGGLAGGDAAHAPLPAGALHRWFRVKPPPAITSRSTSRRPARFRPGPRPRAREGGAY